MLLKICFLLLITLTVKKAAYICVLLLYVYILCFSSNCYRLEPSIGDTADFSGSSCKDILESHSSNCFRPATDGPYWVRVTDQCSEVEQTMRVYYIWYYMCVCVPLTTIKDTCGGVVDIAMRCKSLIGEEFGITV